MTQSDAEATLLAHIRFAGLPEPVSEYRFAKSIARKWRADFAYVEHKLLLEVEGGIYVQGRHTRPMGYENDVRKYNNAVLLGFRLLRFTPAMIESGEALAMIEQALDKRGQSQ